MRPRPGEVLHFSEDPDIREFRPHVARTASDPTAYVWAVDAANAPSYWLPRDCPRATAWVTDETTVEDRDRLLGPQRSRVHMIEYGWLPKLKSARVVAYRFAAEDFEPYGDPKHPHAFVSDRPVYPLAQAEPVGDLLALHADAGIELRLTDSLWPWWNHVIASNLGFSGIRLRHALSPGDRPH